MRHKVIPEVEREARYREDVGAEVHNVVTFLQMHTPRPGAILLVLMLATCLDSSVLGDQTFQATLNGMALCNFTMGLEVLTHGTHSGNALGPIWALYQAYLVMMAYVVLCELMSGNASGLQIRLESYEGLMRSHAVSWPLTNFLPTL